MFDLRVATITPVMGHIRFEKGTRDADKGIHS